MEGNLADTSENRLHQLVQRVIRLQANQGLSDNKFSAKYRIWLGSQKAWSALKSGNFEGYLSPDAALKRLEQLCANLDGGAPVKNFFESLPFAKQMNARLDLLRATDTDRRVVVCLAPTGCGKSVWGRKTCDANQDTMSYVRCLPTWRDNMYGIAQGTAKVVGAPLCSSPRHQVDAVVDYLKSDRQRIIVWDEGHDGGVQLMKFIKALIDECGTRHIYQAFPTEFDRVRFSSEGAIAEAKQFLGRTQKPVFEDYREGVGSVDIIAYLQCKGQIKASAEDLSPIAEQMVSNVRRNGNFRVLDDAILDAQAEADARQIELTAGMVNASLNMMCRVFGPNGGKDGQ
ncbi:MAG TPA: hypothetical protein VMF06_20150 [Candidatus Limnocylindria bacterium]|jgi:hypothetical protein|nr:hypothetical protein [Candidatus Limnocylindria bacterium]